MFHDEYSCPSPSVVLKRCKRLDAAQNTNYEGDGRRWLIRVALQVNGLNP